MRISSNFIYENSRLAMQKSIANLLSAQEVMATQRKVNRLSDDPVALGRILKTESMVQIQDQFLNNVGVARTMAELYDSAFTSAHGTLSRVKELLIAEANSATSTDVTREAARLEIISLANELVGVGNLQYNNRYLFAGYADDRPAFVAVAQTADTDGIPTVILEQSVRDPAAVNGSVYEIVFTSSTTYDINNAATGASVSQNNPYDSGELIQIAGVGVRFESPRTDDVFTVDIGQYVGDSGVVRLELEQDVFESVTFNGAEVFRGIGGGIDVFDLFDRAYIALRNNNQGEISALLDSFDAAISQTSQYHTQVGARENLLDTTESRLLDLKLNMQILLSDLRDVDITDAVTELNRTENAYQAVLAATARTLQPTLLDFLG